MQRVAFFGALMVAGTACSADMGTGSGGVADQTEFDLTVLRDRRQFDEHDLTLRQVLPPYVVYEVTGPEPRLGGPLVRVWMGPIGGFAMLCSANHYFAPARDGSPSVAMRLVGGESGDEVLVESHQEALQLDMDEGAGADDQYGEEPIGDGTDGAPEAGDPDAPVSDAAVGVQPIAIQLDPAPPEGSWILLRRLAISSYRIGHNDANHVPYVRCTSAGCTLDE